MSEEVQSITEQTKLQLPLSVVVSVVLGIIGGAAWLTTLQLGQASLISTVQTMRDERKEERREFTDALKALQETTQRTQLDVVEMKGDIKAIRRK